MCKDVYICIYEIRISDKRHGIDQSGVRLQTCEQIKKENFY